MKNIKLLFSLGAIALLVACSDPRPPEEIVAERAQARLDAMVARDFAAVWEYQTPGFREETPRAAFESDLKRRPVHWIDGEVGQVRCEPKRCEVEVKITYKVPNAPAQLAGMGNTRPLTEIWISTGGGWWYTRRQ